MQCLLYEYSLYYLLYLHYSDRMVANKCLAVDESKNRLCRNVTCTTWSIYFILGMGWIFLIQMLFIAIFIKRFASIGMTHVYVCLSRKNAFADEWLQGSINEEHILHCESIDWYQCQLHSPSLAQKFGPYFTPQNIFYRLINMSTRWHVKSV